MRVETFVAFCGNCKSLVYPPAGGGPLTCKKCGWSGSSPAASNVHRSETSTRIRVVREEGVDVRPQQAVTCPKCGNDKAYFHLMQTRRSDEPPTQINECVQCHHSWRDYG